MTILTQARPRPCSIDPQHRRIFPPGWPPPGMALRVLFIGYPIWWIVGATEFACLGAAAVMAYELAREKRVELPRGFLLWLLFLVWVFAGIFLLQVNAPGAVPGAQNTRYVTWAFRLMWYVGATVVMVYVITMRRRLPVQQLLQAFSWLFVTLTVGGLLGVLRPQVEVQSVLEILLPASIDSIPFVRDLIHPTVAQLYTNDGSLNPRPSAPFPYTNDWGVTYACLLPLFLISWFRKDAGWRRFAGPVVLLASLVPVIQSLNRGLWLALIGMGLYVMVRALFLGKVRFIAAGVGVLVALVAVVALSPLRGVVENRLQGEAPSNDSRYNLGTQSIATVTERSPIAGLGTTRDVSGSFTSIAVGSTAACPLCSPPALGTQGQLWLVMFAQGLVGLVFYLGFLLLQLVGHQRLRSGTVTAASCVLIGHFITMPFYGAIGPALFVIMAAIGLLTREAEVAGRAVNRWPWSKAAPLTTTRDYSRVVRANAVLLIGTVTLGVFGGTIWQYFQEPSVVAEVRIVLPVEPSYDLSGTRALSLDTTAQYATGRDVVEAVREASDQPYAGVEDLVTVSALPNTRVLVLRIVAPTAQGAEAGAAAAAEQFLVERNTTLEDRQDEIIDTLDAQAATSAQGVSTIDTAIRLLVDTGVDRDSLSLLAAERIELVSTRDQFAQELAEAQGADLREGWVVKPGEARWLKDDWNLSLTTGALLGLLFGIGLVLVFPTLRDRGSVGADA